MHCAFFGNGNKTIVYLHGWGADGRCFAPVAACLPEFYNVMPDLNGFGKSPSPPKEGWNVTDYAEQVRLLCAQYNIQRATFVCHSFGCRVALCLAADYPELCDGLVLYAAAGLRRFSLLRTLRVAKYKCTKTLRRLAGLEVKPCGSADYIATADNLKSTFVKVVNTDLSSYARRVRCPVLLLNGNADNVTPPSHAKRLRRMLPRADLHLLDGDHFSLFYTPSVFAKIVQEFSEQ